MKQVLVIGGTASIAKKIVEELEINGYSIHLMTFRQKNKIYGNYNWVELDLEKQESLKEFISNLPKSFYSKIIINVGNSLGNNYKEIGIEKLDSFFSTYLSHYLYMITKLVESLVEDGHIVSMSSIAANRAIPDIYYSAAKAGVQAAVKSLSSNIGGNKVSYSIAPGLIYDTPAMYHNNYDDYKDQIPYMATKEKIAEIIIKADISYNGKVIEIGY